MEVPLPGSDSTRWNAVSVPAPRIPPAAKCSCPAPANAAGAVLVPSDSNKARDRFIVWRVHESSPSIMELVQLSATQDFPSHGLQLSFEEALCPFADVLPIEVNNGQGLYFSLTIVATSGIAYVLKLPVSTELWSSFMFSSSNLITRDLSNEFYGLQQVTAFAAAKNILFAGGQSGSVLCFSLFADASASQNSCFELKGGDAGLGRLWGFVRSKTVASVKTLGVQEIHNRSVVFALHEDGGLQAWDPLHHVRMFSHNISPSAVSSASRMWIEDGAFAAGIQLAILFDRTQENETQTICLYSLDPLSSSGLQLGLPTLQQAIPLDQFTVLDVKLVQGSLWLLKESGENSHELIQLKLQLGVLPQHYHLQEEELREQLVCSESINPDDLSALPGLPELFLRRLLQPRVFHPETAQDVLRARGAAISDSSLRSFTEDDWRREFSTILSNEWSYFIAEYVKVWTKNHVPYALLSDSTTGCMGLVRKSSLSLIRNQTRIEKSSSVNSSPFVDGKESQILTALLGCMREICLHLGPLSLATFNESLLQREGPSIDQLVSSCVRELEIGQSTPASSNCGLDDLRSKVKELHLKQRKFKFRVSQALREIGSRAGGWPSVFEFIAGYERFLLYGSTQKLCRVSTSGNALTKLITQATSQILWAHYQECRNLILLFKFIVSLKGQVNLTAEDAARIQLEIYPRLKKIMLMNFLLYWLTVAPGETPYSDDFNSLLSSLRIDGKNNNAWTGNVGFGQVTLGEILASSFFDAAPVTLRQNTGVLVEKADLLDYASGFITWLSLGEEAILKFPRRLVALSVILLQHGQYRGLEKFLAIVEKFSNDQAYHDDNINADGESSARLHLFGLCLLARACSGANETRNPEQIKEASSCFFRAAEGLGESSNIFHSVFSKMGVQQYDPAAQASWKLHYFEWVMQLFEQYNLSDVATEFALAAIDQVDKASNMKDASGTKGRLWANIFKFSMDLELYGPAYSAIISNPDEEVKLTCLRRFVVVLCERKATLTLCGGDFPYAGLLEIVEQELAWKAEYSDICAKPSPYKLLYGFHVHRHNYRRAAECMYRYASRMRDEGVSKSRMQVSIALQEQVNGLAAAINSLRLVSSSFAWISGEFLAIPASSSPSKRLCLTGQTDASHVAKPKEDTVIDVEELEKQYVIASAKLELVQANVRHPTIGDLSPVEVVALLVQNGLYNTAFTSVFKLWKGSVLNRELEKVFELMARNCCTTGLLTRPPNEKLLALPDVERPHDKGGDAPGTKSSWQSLQTNLEKYRAVHPRLPVIVAETILSVNKNMELPIWLAEMLKASRTTSPMGLGMAGQGDPAALLRIYIDNGRLVEASMLVLDYLRAWANMAPSDILKRKQMSAAWFPYLLIDRLLQSLSELSDGDLQCAELRTSLQTALQTHLKQAKEDSDDVISLVNHA